MGARGSADHWHAKVYRGTEAKVGEQRSIAHANVTKLRDERVRASITLPGLLPRGEYAWGIYEGDCTGTLVGYQTVYPNIIPDENSRGSFTAILDANLMPEFVYYVTIFRTGGERSEVLGCVPLEQGLEIDSDGVPDEPWVNVRVTSEPTGARVYFIPHDDFREDSFTDKSYLRKYEVGTRTNGSLKVRELKYAVVFVINDRFHVVRNVFVVNGENNEVNAVFPSNSGPQP